MFGAYNSSLWPAILLIRVATAIVVWPGFVAGVSADVWSSAAFALGIRADMVLAVAAALLALDLVAPSVLGQRTAAGPAANLH